jgi:protein TBF1
MIIDSEPPLPTQSPESPLKRSRSPENVNAFGDNGHREEKRMKIEPATENGLDEIARMVQAVQASVMQDILSTSAPDLEPALESRHEPETGVQPQPQLQHDSEPQPHIEQSTEVFETTEQEQVNIESVLEAALGEQRSPSRDADTRPDTLWNNPRDYTRRKHIIPALGALVSGSCPRISNTCANVARRPWTY